MRVISTSMRSAVTAAAVLTLTAAAGVAQTPGTQRIGEDSWRISASVGTYVPRSAVIVGLDGRDTRLGAAPSFSLDVQNRFVSFVSGYANATLAFSRLSLGGSIRSSVVGPSDAATLLGGTLGVVLTTSANGWFGEYFRPTLRLGGGVKGYSFDLADVDRQWRTTGDFGVGFLGTNGGHVDVLAEMRFLPSSFDQGKLPTRSIVPQAQQQNDLIFSIGISVRP